jgi:hypothetical protein
LRRRKGKNTEGRRKNLYVDAWEEDKGWNTDMFMPPDLMQFQVAADTRSTRIKMSSLIDDRWHFYPEVFNGTARPRTVPKSKRRF